MDLEHLRSEIDEKKKHLNELFQEYKTSKKFDKYIIYIKEKEKFIQSFSKKASSLNRKDSLLALDLKHSFSNYFIELENSFKRNQSK